LSDGRVSQSAAAFVSDVSTSTNKGCEGRFVVKSKKKTARFPFKRTQRTHASTQRNARIARNASACAGNHDWLLRSSIPIGWRLRSLREKSYAMTACVSCVTCACVLLFFFACVIFLGLLRFLRTFYFACVFFSYARLCCIACV